MSLTNHPIADLNFALHEIRQQERCVSLHFSFIPQVTFTELSLDLLAYMFT